VTHARLRVTPIAVHAMCPMGRFSAQHGADDSSEGAEVQFPQVAPTPAAGICSTSTCSTFLLARTEGVHVTIIRTLSAGDTGRLQAPPGGPLASLGTITSAASGAAAGAATPGQQHRQKLRSQQMDACSACNAA